MYRRLVIKLIFTQHHRTLCGAILLAVGFLTLVAIIGSWIQQEISEKRHEAKLAQIEKKRAWELHFGLSLNKPLSEIQAIPGDAHVVVSGVDFTLHDSVREIQNNNFDSIYIDDVEGVVYVNIFKPSSVQQAEVTEFLFYQAATYALIVKKLNPSLSIKRVGVTAYEQGGGQKWRQMFDYDHVVGLSALGYEKTFASYKKISQKKAPN